MTGTNHSRPAGTAATRWVTVRNASDQQVHHWLLVLAAAGIPSRLRHDRQGWRIEVEEEFCAWARREIELYEQENQDWPPHPGREADDRREVVTEQPVVVPVLAGLAAIYGLSGPWQDGSLWFSRGVVSVRAVLEQHEWYRLITALTLHANPGHLAGNLLVGGVLAYFLGQQLGSGFTWLLVLASGILGNGLNVWFRAPGFQSVGFSTAVFGMVGLAGGLSLGGRLQPRRLLLALGAAGGLLALLGTGGKGVDLGAHLWGLVWGALLGWATGRWLPRSWLRNPWLQAACFGAAAILVTVAWVLAFSA